jgi:hypothetical protein
MRTPLRARRQKGKPDSAALPQDSPQLFSTKQAAAYIGMSAPFLAIGRQTGIVGNRTPPPPHLKIGRAVRYARADLDAWLAARRVDPVARKAGAVKHAARGGSRTVEAPQKAAA